MTIRILLFGGMFCFKVVTVEAHAMHHQMASAKIVQKVFFESVRVPGKKIHTSLPNNTILTVVSILSLT